MPGPNKTIGGAVLAHRGDPNAILEGNPAQSKWIKECVHILILL
jgi:hypothetical protein